MTVEASSVADVSSGAFPMVPLGEVIRHRKEFIEIEESQSYKRCRVRLHAAGIVLRDIVTGSEIKTKRQQVCQAGEFLVAEIDAKVGGFGIVPDDLEGAIVSSHYFLFTIDEARLDRRFLGYYIRTPTYRDQVTAQGTTNYSAIRPSHVLNYIIPLPPLHEQQRIVARLDEVAAKVADVRNLRADSDTETESLWQSSLSAAFQPMVSQGSLEGCDATSLLNELSATNSAAPNDSYNNAHPSTPNVHAQGLFNIPSHWVWTDLGSILSHIVDCVNDTPEFAQSPTEYLGLKSTNIRPYRLGLSQRWYMTQDDFVHWNRRRAPQTGDLVLTREAPVGNVCQLPDGVQVCLTQRLMLLRCDERFIDPRWILHYLNCSHFREQLLDKSRGLTTPHIRVRDVPQFLIPLAPLEEQHRLMDELDDIQRTIARLKTVQVESREALENLVPAVLDRAFKGAL